MERKEFLSSAKLCRFCLSQNPHSLMNLFDETKASNATVPLEMKILSSVTVEVFPSDKMPPYICSRCNFFMNLIHKYKQVCRTADKTLLHYIQEGSALEPVTWPPALVKIFRYGAKAPSEVGVVKTVIEGGTTVEVTSQEVSDSEEDEDENVYSIKLGETPEDVKLVTSKEPIQESKEKPKGKKKDEEYEKDATRPHPRMNRPQEGCWACDECNCTYPLMQMLELHKMQKHRARTVACDQCEAKFFTKYDLKAHLQRHSDEMPFECTACDRKFKRLVMLKRHEKFQHSDMKQYKCKHCPATFICLKQFTSHNDRHTAAAEKRSLQCHHCSKRFPDKTALNRHIEAVHTMKLYSCDYCPEHFSNVRGLMKHIRTHAGDRMYPCKFCDKRFTKSQHYSRHLKVKHGDQSTEQTGNAEDYRCDQCEASFTTQDELIYHSAIHATQNLTCPLCQEKFDNVDDVTAHIKSHVTGTEFMCDLCELVFTSKDKLDTHLVTAHDEEIRNELAQEESSMDMDEDDDEDAGINVKDAGDHMLVEINKPDGFLIKNTTATDTEDKFNSTNSEESEPETSAIDLPAVIPVTTLPVKLLESSAVTISPLVISATADCVKSPERIVIKSPNSTPAKSNNAPPPIIRKAEEIKRTPVKLLPEASAAEKRLKSKVETGGASDKSLRLLEKELQDLQRTNTRNDQPKTPKISEAARTTRRPQIHTSTPKVKSVEEKKSLPPPKPSPVEKKQLERRGVKENKEPKEVKEPKTNNVSAKEDKPNNTKEEKVINIKTVKTVMPAKDGSEEMSVVKNGASNKSNPDESVIRRSSRPSKVKDYAKMIRERTEPSDDESSSDDDEEYVDHDRSTDNRPRGRRGPAKPAPKPTPSPAAAKTPARKRGRPRKEPPKEEVPAKVKKDEKVESDQEEEEESSRMVTEEEKPEEKPAEKEDATNDSISADASKREVESEPNKTNLSMGSTLKKVPIKALPPGVKPLPLPTNPRPMGPGELCEMQIGKKVVKVQKIVMTKAEVEAMAKKGLVEMKDGTMVLKQGIKIPTSDPNALKSTLVGEDPRKESPSKLERGTPTRCSIGDA